MGWVWKSEPEGENSNQSAISEFGGVENPNPRSDGGDYGRRGTTRTVVRSRCRTEEVEPGKFLRKCERTEEILRDSIGRPTEVVQSNKEYTEEDVTDEVIKGSSDRGSFEFPGLRSDLEAIEKSFNFPGLRGDIDEIERSFFGGLSRFVEAAEEMRNGFFGVFGDPNVFGNDSSPSSSSASNNNRGIPVEKPDSGHVDVDLSGLARDV